MPALMAPQKVTGKSTVSSMIMATRASRATPKLVSRLAIWQDASCNWP